MDDEISQNLDGITIKLGSVLNEFDAKEIKSAMAPIDELMKDIQKTVDNKLRDPAERLVARLEQDEDLTLTDIEVIKKWLVGDSESYTRIENNLIDWIAECKRLLTVLKHYKTEEILDDENNLLALGALLTDLKYTLTDVQRYSKAMNEVDKLKSMACGGTPNAETKKKLSEMIKKKLDTV